MNDGPYPAIRRMIRNAMASLRATSAGGYALLAALFALLVGAIVVAWLGWASAPEIDVPTSGYVALVIGVGFSLVVGVGLMTLVFASSRLGYDEPAELMLPDTQEDRHDHA